MRSTKPWLMRTWRYKSRTSSSSQSRASSFLWRASPSSEIEIDSGVGDSWIARIEGYLIQREINALDLDSLAVEGYFVNDQRGYGGYGSSRHNGSLRQLHSGRLRDILQGREQFLQYQARLFRFS